MRVDSQDQDTKGTSLFDFEDSQDSTGGNSRIEVLIITAPYASLSRDDILSGMADEYREKLRMSDGEIAAALKEDRSVSSGGVRFSRLPAGDGGVFDELDRAGDAYTPTDKMQVWIPSLALLGHSIEGIVEGIRRIYGYEIVSALLVSQSYIYISREKVDLLSHLVEDVPVELNSQERQCEISTGNETYTGRPPVGFEVDDGSGELVPADNYQHVCDILQLVESNEMSKRQASQQIEASPRTITRILSDPERREMYFG